MSNDDEKRNFLRLRAANFSFELEGEPEFILETYDNVRHDVLRRLNALMGKGQVAPAPMPDPYAPDPVPRPNEHLQAPQASPYNRPIVSTRARPEIPKLPKGKSQQHYVWVYVTHEIYNKVYVVDSPTFLASPLSRFLDGVRLRKIFLDRTHQETLRPLVGTGKTLWSELTKKGREQLANPGK